MSTVQPPALIAITVADIHLSHTAPAARACEPSWYAVMERQLAWLGDLQREYGVPVLAAGDIFHKYNSPAELINFALVNLPDRLFTVCGQHDLAYHDLSALHKSAYGTLMAAGKITHVSDSVAVSVGGYDVYLYGFSFGQGLKPCSPVKSGVHMVMVHDYCYAGEGFPNGILSDKSVEEHLRNAMGYDFLIFGDNHIPHDGRYGATTVINCGGVFRRTINEVVHRPSATLIYADGSYRREYFPVDADMFVEKRELVQGSAEIGAFVEYLTNTTTDPLDVESVLSEYMRVNSVSKPVRDEIYRLLGAVR